MLAAAGDGPGPSKSTISRRTSHKYSQATQLLPQAILRVSMAGILSNTEHSTLPALLGQHMAAKTGIHLPVATLPMLRRQMGKIMPRLPNHHPSTHTRRRMFEQRCARSRTCATALSCERTLTRTNGRSDLPKQAICCGLARCWEGVSRISLAGASLFPMPPHA